MNIFVTDRDPTKSAINLDDLRVNKMILESASLLANAIAYHGGTPADLPIAKTSGKPFKTKAWQNHPCCVWVKESSENYRWLLNHLIALIDEKYHRTGKIHSMQRNVEILIQGIRFLPPGQLTPHVICTPYKQISDPIESYRITMANKWANDKRFPKWTNRDKPEWYTSRYVGAAQPDSGLGPSAFLGNND